MNSSDILFSLISGDNDADLPAIIKAAQDRLTAAQGTSATATFKIGQRVEMNSKTRPAYMIGKQGRVTKINQTTCLIAPDPGTESGRFTGTKQIKCPKSLLTIIAG